MKKLTVVLLGINLLMFIYISFFDGHVTLSMADAEVQERESYLNIVTTDKCSYNMVKKIVGNKHNVKYLFKTKEEMMNYKPTTEAMSNISNMDLFIYLGADNEPWIQEFINGLVKGKVGIIDLSRGIRILNYEEPKKLGEMIINENSNYLLSPEEYKVALYNIKTAVQEKDVESKDLYEENFNKVRQELDKELSKGKKEIQKGLKTNFYTLDEKGEYLFNYLGISVKKIKLEDLEDSDNFNEEENNVLIQWGNGQSLEENEVISNGVIKVLNLQDETSGLKGCNSIIENVKNIGKVVKDPEVESSDANENEEAKVKDAA